MGRKSEAIQFYGVGVPWGQRPQSLPYIAPITRPITCSVWDNKALESPITANLPTQVTRPITCSVWNFEARESPILAGSPLGIFRDITCSVWNFQAQQNAITTNVPADLSRDITCSVWQWVAMPTQIEDKPSDCCERIYTPIGQCLRYQSVCCED